MKFQEGFAAVCLTLITLLWIVIGCIYIHSDWTPLCARIGVVSVVIAILMIAISIPDLPESNE